MLFTVLKLASIPVGHKREATLTDTLLLFQIKVQKI